MNTEVVQDKESKGGTGYVGRRPSRKEVKIMIMHAKTPEERKVLASMMPKSHKRHN